jgi:outer membrane protein assembly factor BamB
MTLTLSKGLLYVGGQFTTLNGAAHTYLGALTATTGAIDSTFRGSADAEVTASAMTVDQTKLIVGGSFTHTNGTSQSHIAALNPTTGAALAWASHTSYPIVGITTDSLGVYIAGTGGGGTFASFNPTTGHINWQDGTNGNIQAVAILDGYLYSGGHYDTYCGPGIGQQNCATPTTRLKILAVDETTGTLQPWNPSVNSVLGVFALAAGSGTLTMGGDFTNVAGTDQQGFAKFTE